MFLFVWTKETMNWKADGESSCRENVKRNSQKVSQQQVNHLVKKMYTYVFLSPYHFQLMEILNNN